jgi:PBSX family phage terminase large subunit
VSYLKRVKQKSKSTKKRVHGGIELRGGNGELFNSTEHEVLCCGPAETGKTLASCIKAHAICCAVPGAQGAIIRKTYASLVGSVIKTFLRVIQPDKRGIQVFGGEKPERFIYPNGSTIWMGGMDNPNRILSSERDFIYVNQAEELSEADWETLLTRCTGRGSVVKNPQLFGDCNPSGSSHWIRKRNSLRLINTTHADNPSLFTAGGVLTEQGRRTMAALGAITGIRRKRLFEGIWATAEGAVFDNFDASKHVCVRQVEDMRRFYLAMDEGFTNPAVILVVGEDSDGRWHVFREFYQSGVLQETVVKMAQSWQAEFTAEMIAVDESAAGLIADLKACGLNAIGGKGRVIDGINRLQNRLAVAGDGRARLTFDPSCANGINEFESYVWAQNKSKDVPVKEHDHVPDSIRYLADVTESLGSGGFAKVVNQRAADCDRVVLPRYSRRMVM